MTNLTPELKAKFEAIIEQYRDDSSNDWVLNLMLQAYELERWIDAVRETPKLIKGKDYSENVLAIINGELGVACFCYIDCDRQESGYAWANCYNDLDGDAEFYDEYDVTFWQPMPKPPTK